MGDGDFSRSSVGDGRLSFRVWCMGIGANNVDFLSFLILL